jgi:class 3 adenylate cyclase/tetratricopeptide (TPR) repeat protein
MKATMSAAQEERRLLTILFADLSGFTAISSKLDPEEVREVANLCFEHLNKAIIGQGGTIHKYEGDLVMALFGHPVAHEDDPERAIRASFAMFELLPEVNRALAARLLKPTDIGLHVGINSGTVVVGEMGSSEKKEYTVMGDAVNLASRMKDLAGRGEIVVSEPVFRASRYLFEYEPREPVAVKGIDEPVRTFRPTKEKAKPESKRGIQGLTAPLVGRDLEIGQLKHRAEALAEGKGGAGFILGDAGLGKSRLLEELKQWLIQERMPVVLLEGRCLSYCENVPYWPFLQVLRAVFGITDQDSREAVGDKLLNKSRALFPSAWQDVVPYLGVLFSIRFPDALDEKVKYLDSKSLKTQILASTRRLFAELARTQPLLLVIEDYHWIDQASLELLEYLFESPEPFPMLLLALSRVEKEKAGNRVREQLKAKLGPDFLEITLTPLSRIAGTRLIYSLLKIPGFSEEFKDRILAKAEGNPFYLEEIVRSLIDSGILFYREGNWLLTSEVDAFTIPDTVQAVIATRLDKLEKDVREVLQMASVIGRNFPIPVLEHLTSQAGMMLTLYLAALEEHEFIAEAGRKPEREYLFRHPLFQEVAYTGLLKTRRRELHRRIGEVIEALYPGRLEEFTEVLAYQYGQGDDPGKALEWLGKAGRKAQERFANDEAIDCFRQTLPLLRSGGAEAARGLFEALDALGDLHRVKGEYPSALECYGEMQTLAREDRIQSSTVRAKVADIYHHQGRYAEALKVLEEAEGALTGATREERVEVANVEITRSRMLHSQGDLEAGRSAAAKGLEILAAEGLGTYAPEEDPRITRLRARGLNELGLFYFETDDYERAKVYFQQNMDLDERLTNKPGICMGYNNLGLVCKEKGEASEAAGFFERSLAVAEEMGNKASIGKACNNLGLLYYTSGDFDKALAWYEKDVEAVQDAGERYGICVSQSNVGLVLLEKGDTERARAVLTQTLAGAEEIGSKVMISYNTCLLGRVAIAAGERDEAERCLLKSEGVAREMGDKGRLIEALSALSELKALGSEDPGFDPAPSRAYADQVSQLAREVGSPFYIADSHYTSSRIQAASGDFSGSEASFKEAIAILEKYNVRKYLADAYVDFARMIRKAAAKGVLLATKPEDCLEAARGIYQDLNLPNKAAECR